MVEMTIEGRGGAAAETVATRIVRFSTPILAQPHGTVAAD
jgi:hypothetical protein